MVLWHLALGWLGHRNNASWNVRVITGVGVYVEGVGGTVID